MFVIDTNVVSEIRKASTRRTDPEVAHWADNEPAGNFYLSVVTIMEIEIGIQRAARRDHFQGEHLRDWLDSQLLPLFQGYILDINIEIARRCATLFVPDPRPERDALIAATALVHNMTVVTRNTRDFEPMGVAVINPWDQQ